jgi:hypothetical protein
MATVPRPPAEPPQDGQPLDPFDLDALRVEGLDDISTEKVLLTVPARKPKAREFFRVHPGDDYTLDSLVFERVDGLDREVYLVAKHLRAELAGDCQRVRLFTCMSKRGVLFLWPARLPDDEAAGGGGRAWHSSALETAEEAKKSWVRMQGDRDLGAYVMHRAKGDLGEPAWPDMTFRDLIALAFKDRLIDTPHHDVLRELRGEL